jgi:Ca-activated chloride channel family protein
MRFAFPYFSLLFIVVLYLIYRFFVSKKKNNDSAYISYSDLRLIKLGVEKSGISKFLNRKNILNILRILLLISAILALCRPQAQNKIQEVLSPGYDIMLCIDTSTSMLAEDFKPNNRFFVAREVAKDFIKNRPYDRIGLVVFAGIAYIQCPLTVDHGALLEFLSKVEIGITNIDGTAIGTAIVVAASRFKDLKAKEKIIIIMTDGRNNAGEVDPLTAANLAKSVGVKIYTIGVGTIGEALYPINDSIFGKRYIKMQEDLDEPTLKKIAEITGGQYFRATNEKNLKEIYKTIDKLEKTEVKIKEYNEYKELYLYFLVPALILLVLEILIGSFFWIKLP